MFETTLEAQGLDRSEQRLGTLSAAVLAHAGIGLAIVAVTALIVPPVKTPDPPELIGVIFPKPIPIGDPTPVTTRPKPLKGTDHPAVSQPVVPLPPVEPVAPSMTPDRLPDAPPSSPDAGERDGSGTPGNPLGDDNGVPGGPGTGPTGGGNGLDDGSAQPLTGEMERPVLLSKAEPVYPNSARIARMMGRVVVEAVIGLDGHVESAEVISSTSALFDRAAADAVRQWRYKPALMNGRPVRVYFKVQVEFVLR